MKEAERVRKTAENSVGSAWREQEKWATSLQGHLGSLNASFEKFASISLNNAWIKFFIDLVKGVLDLGSALGGLIPVLTVIGIKLASIKTETIGISVISLITKIPLLVSAFESLEAIMISLDFTTTAFSATLATITGGLSLAIVGAILLIKHLHQSSAELQQQLGKTADEYKQHTENINNYTSELETAKKRLEELNKLKEQGNITAKQVEELNNLQLQNNELEKKLEIEKTLANLKQKEQNKEALEVLGKKEIFTIKRESTAFNKSKTFNFINKEEQIKKLFNERKRIDNAINRQQNNDTKLNAEKEIQRLEKAKDNLEGQLGSYLSDFSETVGKLSDGFIKDNYNKQLEKWVKLLSKISDTTKDATENIVNLGNISSKYKDSDSLKNEQEDLQKYYDEYDKNGILSVQTVNDMLAKYPQYLDFLIKTADGYKLNTDALERLNNIKQTQKDITNKYIDSLNREKDAISSRDFAKQGNSILSRIKNDYNDKSISVRTNYPDGINSKDNFDKIGYVLEQKSKTLDALSIEGFNDLIDKISEANTKFANGKTNITEYFTQIKNSIDSVDLSKFTESDLGQNALQGLRDNIQNAISFANSELQKGKINAIEYTKAIELANQSMLDLYVAQKGLVQDDNGKWRDNKNLIDEYADSLSKTQNELQSFNDYLSLLSDNATYLGEHLNAIGDIAFTTADTMTTAYQSFADSMDSMLDKLSTTNKTAFNDIVDNIVVQTDITREALIDSQGQFNRSTLNNADVLNNAIKGSTNSLSKSVTTTVNAIGKMLGSFKYELRFVPKLKIGSLVDAFKERDPSKFVSGALEITAHGGYDSGSVFSPETEKLVGESISDTWKTGDLLGISNKGNSTPANRNSSGSSKGGGSKGGSNRTDTPVELKEIEKVDEYTKAIDKLNFKLEILGNDREFLVNTSDEYVKSLNTEISLIREKSSLTDKEIEKVEKELKTYNDLDKQKIKVEQLRKNAKTNDDKKQVNNEIEKYNKRLSTRESLEKKLQSLHKTNIDLEKQEIQIKQKKYDLVLKSSNDEISNNEKQISLLQSKQKFFAEDSVEYSSLTDTIDKEYDNIEKILKQRQIEIKAILSSPYLSGDTRKSLENELVENETKYQNTRLSRFENSKQKRLKDIEKSVESVTKILDPLENRIELLSTKLSLISTDDFTNRINLLGEAFNLTKEHIDSLSNAYERLNAIQPQTKEEAEKIASEMKNVASKILQAKKSMWEYHKQIDVAKVDELSANYKKQFGELNGLISEFKHNLDMLSGGLVDGTDINFGISILPDTPRSSYDREKASLDELFKEQEEYERNIRQLKDKSYNEQLAEFKKLNEEIQKDANGHYMELINNLINSLDKEEFVQDSKHKNIYSAIVQSLTNIKGAYIETWDSIVEKVIKAISQIESATKQGLYAYANFSKEGQFIGITKGKSGTSNHLPNADYVVSANGKKYSTKKKIPKYANGTKLPNNQNEIQDEHQGGYALVGEEGEELAILPSGKSVMLGIYGAELVNLPKGTTVIPNNETKELKSYLGNDLDVKTIPRYAKGVFGATISRAIASAVASATSRARNSNRNHRDSNGASQDIKEVIKETVNYFKYNGVKGNYNAITQRYDDYSATRKDKNSTIWQQQGISYDRNGYLDNPRQAYEIAKRQHTEYISRKRTAIDLKKANEALEKIKRDMYKAEERNRQNQSSSRSIMEAGYSSASAYGRYKGSENYYNRNDKSEHEKQMDKITYDNFLSKSMVNEYNSYKNNRDSVMNFIKTEQEAIKSHFAKGGLRDTVNQKIDELKSKIDEQTAKDVEMQYKMTDDILKQQKNLAENYMNTTRQKYLDGINSNVSTDALRKLKDEYADAQRQFNDIEKSIKDNITARYEYEFSLIDKKVQKYTDVQDSINQNMKILNSATDSKDYRQQMSLNEKLVTSYNEQLKTLVGEYDKLVNQQGKFGVGSYEWNLFEEKIKAVNKQIGSVNENIASTIANNKKLAGQRLDYVFETQNKGVEKALLNNKTKEQIQRENDKKNEYYQKYLEGLEKEHALDLLKRDLRKEEISDFDTILSQMETSAKITRDEYETLQKQIAVRKLEKALDKALGNLTEKSYVKNDDGTWDWKYQENQDLVKDLQDKLTQAKIDLLKWQKELELKKSDNKLNDVNKFLSDLKDLQKRAINGEFKNKDEFNEELKKLGLDQKDNSIWEDLQKSKMFDENGNFGNIIQLMSKSFENYQTELTGLNSRLEELLKLLKIETNIRLNQWQNGIQAYGYKSYNNNSVDDTTGNKDKISFKNINDLKVLQSILEINKSSIPNFDNIKSNINQYLNNQSSVTTDINKKPNISEINNYFEKLVLPNVTDAKSFIDELKKLPMLAKQFAWGNN